MKQVKTFISSGYTSELDIIAATADEAANRWMEEESHTLVGVTTHSIPLPDSMIAIIHTILYDDGVNDLTSEIK